MRKTLTVATRPTRLALAQTRIVTDALKEKHPGLDVRINQITSEGDKDKRIALWDLKQTGFFTSQLEDALLAGHADLAVHSFKDLPIKQRPGLTITAVLDRKFPEDCLVAAEKIDSIEQLPSGAKIGTSSLRRAAQIKRLRADLQIAPVRGSVPTRIKKVKQGDYDAVIVARAGLERLGLADRISIIFDPAEFIPAPAQGALAVQVRTDDKDIAVIAASIDNPDTRIACLAERLVLEKTGAGCHAPVGATAAVLGEQITITAFIADAEGTTVITESVAGRAKDALDLAAELTDRLLTPAARQILENLNQQNT